MKYVLAARKSHLARLQAHTVVRALKRLEPALEIEMKFRESLGDQNASDPLWKMPEKGVFTEDFVADLRDGRADLVVHSWKDLPLERPDGLEIAATLEREDLRDLLLVDREKWEARAKTGGPVTILSSSPRRAYNLAPFLKTALPGSISEIHFEPVRGNIPTRFDKLFEGSAHGLIMAKAALDRLLSASGEDFGELALKLRAQLQRCRWMCLPLSANPAAAAQGALAIEISSRCPAPLRALLNKLNHEPTFRAVETERKVLGSYGGGCHQKIGVSVLERPYGRVSFLRGLTDGGEVLDRIALETQEESVPPPAGAHAVYAGNEAFHERIASHSPLKPVIGNFWVARTGAWPDAWVAHERDVIWTAGLETWRRLASQGLWVNGSSESLGEEEATRIEVLMGTPVRWTKLTHVDGFRRDSVDFLATYRLEPLSKENSPKLAGKTHFFWKSGSAFNRALELYPEIKSGWHFSGPGHTHRALMEALGPERVRIAMNAEEFRRRVGV